MGHDSTYWINVCESSKQCYFQLPFTNLNYWNTPSNISFIKINNYKKIAKECCLTSSDYFKYVIRILPMAVRRAHREYVGGVSVRDDAFDRPCVLVQLYPRRHGTGHNCVRYLQPFRVLQGQLISKSFYLFVINKYYYALWKVLLYWAMDQNMHLWKTYAYRNYMFKPGYTV